MAHELDIAAKALLREVPEAFAALALGDLPIRSVTAVDKELPSLARRMDKLFRVELEGEDEEPLCLHLEVEANWASNVSERVFEYWSLARRGHPRLASVVICLKPGAKQGKPVGCFETAESGTALRFTFPVIRVWELKAEELLVGGSPALLPLLPFTEGATPERVDQALLVLTSVEPVKRRAELQTVLAAFAGNVFPDVRWLARIPKELLMESTTFQEISEEAERKGRRELVAILLDERFGADAGGLTSRLTLCTASVLDQVARLLASTKPNEELRQALEQLLPKGE